MNEKNEVSPELNFAKANIYQFLRGVGGPVWGSGAAYYGPLMALLGFLGASEFYNGVVNALFWLGFILTQVPAAYYSERLRYKKWAMGFIFILAGASMFVFGFTLFITGGTNLKLMLILFIICYGIATIISGSATPLIFSLLFKIIPPKKLGSWLGVFFMMMSVGGLLGGPVVKKILQMGYPAAFEILFMSTFAFAVAMAIATWLINEPEGELAPQKENFGVYIKHIISIMKNDKNLVRFFVGMWIVVGHYICVTFYSRYALTGGFGINEDQAGLFVSMNLLGYLMASLGPLFIVLYPLSLITKMIGAKLPLSVNIFGAGWIADRFGPKYTLITFQIVAFLGVTIAMMARNVYMFYVVWVFAGFAQICNNIGYSNMTLLSCPIQDKSSYVGLVNFAVFPFVVIVPMVVGALIERNILNYTSTFIISMIMMVIAILYFVFFVDNPQGYKDMKAQKSA
ncbi:MAG: MFS transporter [Candidatus Latescibacteria bacterium]|nr:MFS transporter [Candidatus Latescibacterota bacterium]